MQRALVFLVISCPVCFGHQCTLRILRRHWRCEPTRHTFKGSNSLDAVTKLDMAVFDKTGTLTTGVFRVEKTIGLSEEDLSLVAAVEAVSSHPIARAIVSSLQHQPLETIDKLAIENVPGYGMEV